MALKDIMLRHGTDKVQGHSYADIYEWYFEPHRYREISLLEIGVGGYSDPNAGGHSLRAWKEYFPYGDITSFDIVNKTSLMEDRITIYQGSQADQIRASGVPVCYLLPFTTLRLDGHEYSSIC